MEDMFVTESSFRILGGHGGYFVVEGPEGRGVIDHEGKTLVEPRFDDVRLSPWNGEVEMFICRHWEAQLPNPQYLFDLVDTHGRLMSQNNYGECIGFSEGLAVVKDGLGIKVLSAGGEEVFELSGGWLDPGCCEATFHDKMLRVAARPGFYSCYVDHWGDRCTRAYQHAGDFHCDLAVVSVERPLLMNHKYGAIDRSGRWVVYPKYEYMDAFHSQRARVMKRGKWGYVNTDGELHIPAVWDFAGNFDSRGLAFVSKKSPRSACIITWHGILAVKLPPECTFARSIFEDMMAAKAENKWGFVRCDGSWAIAPQYDEVGDFCGDTAPVKQGGKWSFISTRGIELLEVDGELRVVERGLAYTEDKIYNYGYSKPESPAYRWR